MAFKFSPGCCCGHTCTTCCSDSLNDSAVVDLTTLDWGAGCATCPDLVAEYHLTRTPAAIPILEPPCEWTYDRETDCLAALGPTLHFKLEDFFLRITITNNGDDTCTIELFVGFTAALNDLETAPYGSTFAFYDETVATGEACSGEHTLALSSSDVQATYPECTPSDWPATVTITL